ncbi:coiled-coil domain-containing protein 33 [Anolis sagrei]|uniref:coiled-coil domain-containing protein 33 n=1 Tax=Anolis sagrei TaxID=38937 RepID=UPI00351FED9E
MNLFAGRDEDVYGYSDILVLLRVGPDDLAMHCGRMAFTVSFHEHRPVAQRKRPITPRRLSPLPPTKAEELPEGEETSSLSPSQSLQVPRLVYPVSTSETSTSLLFSMEPHTPQLLTQPPVPHHEAPPEEMDDPSHDRASVSLPSSLSSSPVLLRRLPSDASLHLPSPEDSPKLDFEDGSSRLRVKEDPAEPGQPVTTSPTNNWHLSNPDKESISVTLHGAKNLPPTRKGNTPNPYVVIKTISDEENKQPAQGTTHTATEPSHSPTWDEKVTVEVDSAKAGEEDISLTIADKDTKEVLAKYNIPVRYLRPFHHYHCALGLPRKKDPLGTTLFASIVRKGSLIPRYGGVNYTGLEVFLKGINKPLAHPEGTIVATARIVNNLKAYVKEMKSRPFDASPVPLTVVNFPDPTMEDFDVPRVNNHGYPQLSKPSGSPEQPTWDSSFLFQGRDGATAFSDDTALVIEYFKSRPGEELESGPKPLGFSVLPLTNRVYRKLVADSSKRGLRVEGLPIQDTSLRTKSGQIPTVQLGLQLINSERPDAFLNASTTDGLPLLDTDLVGQLGTIKEPWARPSSKAEAKNSLVLVPHHNASIIEPERKTSELDLLKLPQGELPPHEAFSAILPEKDYDRPIVEEIPEEEPDNYRLALQKMADDIISLRRHIADLENENSALRRNLTVHEDVGRALFQDIDLDAMTKAEIVDRILSLKQKLSSGAREMARMKDRVQKLQNELIRKNDREKDLMMLQRAHQQQQMVLRKCQAKMAKMQALEGAVRQQEKVIERMERMLEGRMKDRLKGTVHMSDLTQGAGVGDAWSKDLYSTLLMENTRLRDELGKSSFNSPIILQQQALPDVFSASSEKLSLISKLEKAEARIQALEFQLEGSARKWGREKQDYSNRLLEQDLGFVRSPASLILQDYLLDEKEGRRGEDEKVRKS